MKELTLKDIREHLNHCIDEGLTIGEQEETLLNTLYEKAERTGQLQVENERLNALLEGNNGMSVKEIRSQFVDLHRRFLNLQTENKRLKGSL